MQQIQTFRTNAPVTPEQYTAIDGAVKTAARQSIVGRRLIPVTGPFGFGKEAVTFDKLTEVSAAQLTYAWKVNANEDAPNLARTTVPLPVLIKDFRINRRSLEASRTANTPLDLQGAKSAAYKVSVLEDDLLLKGYAADGSNYDVTGMYTGAGNTYSTNKDFGTATNIPAAVNGAMALLMADNIRKPYNLVLNSVQYNEANEMISGGGGMTYLDWIEKTIGGVVVDSNSVTAGTGLMMAAGDRGFFDAAIGVDLTTEVEELSLREGRDLFGVVYETIVPRIWESNALCQLTQI